MENLREKKIFIGGIQGSGKTHAARILIQKHFATALIMRVTPDFDGIVQKGCKLKQASLVRATGKPYMEVAEAMAESIVKGHIKPEVIVFDEADLLFQSHAELMPYMNELVIKHRHFKAADGKGTSMIFITRRVQDIPAKITDSCHVRLFFPLEGKNAMTYIAGQDERIPELMQQLKYKDYRFVLKMIGEAPTIHPPLK
jgi:hypothetical protein